MAGTNKINVQTERPIVAPEEATSRGCTMDDRKLSAEALAKLEAMVLRRLGNRVCRLEIAHEDGGLILRGVAMSYYAKQLVQHAVMEVIDVPIQANEIEVV
jgi:hypothetical protein